MPDTVTRLRDRRVTIMQALVALGVMLAVLQLVVGYGNSYQSCERTASTRLSANLRVEHAATFWSDIVAGSRGRAGAGFLTTAGELHHMPGEVARILERNAREQAATNLTAATGFRAYAAQLLKDRSDVPNCRRFPPPAS